jgi:hypothetical protein
MVGRITPLRMLQSSQRHRVSEARRQMFIGSCMTVDVIPTLNY